jgi:hypothetical protein
LRRLQEYKDVQGSQSPVRTFFERGSKKWRVFSTSYRGRGAAKCTGVELLRQDRVSRMQCRANRLDRKNHSGTWQGG